MCLNPVRGAPCSASHGEAAPAAEAHGTQYFLEIFLLHMWIWRALPSLIFFKKCLACLSLSYVLLEWLKAVLSKCSLSFKFSIGWKWWSKHFRLLKPRSDSLAVWDVQPVRTQPRAALAAGVLSLAQRRCRDTLLPLGPASLQRLVRPPKGDASTVRGGRCVKNN